MIFWFSLFGIILINLKYRKSGVFYLWMGFYIFCIASIINIVNLTSVAEFFMRISFIFWLFGFGLIFKHL